MMLPTSLINAALFMGCLTANAPGSRLPLYPALNFRTPASVVDAPKDIYNFKESVKMAPPIKLQKRHSFLCVYARHSARTFPLLLKTETSTLASLWTARTSCTMMSSTRKQAMHFQLRHFQEFHHLQDWAQMFFLNYDQSIGHTSLDPTPCSCAGMLL